MQQSHEPQNEGGEATSIPLVRRARAVAVDGVRSLALALVTAWAEPAGTRRTRTVRLPFRGPVEVELVVIGDLLLAVVLWGSSAASLQELNWEAGSPYSIGFTLLLAALSTAPLLLRWRWPLAAWRSALIGLLVAAVALQPLLAFPIELRGMVVYALCLYTVGLRTRREVALGAWLASMVAVVGIELLLVDAPFSTGRVALAGAVVAVPVLFGDNLRERREVRAQMADEKRRSEQERAARAVLEERSRIARELHDVVAHHMSVIAIQAEAAPMRGSPLPPDAKSDFAEIRQTALQALTETRRILGVLRQDDAQPDPNPQPGIDRLLDLTDSAASAGLDVTVSVEGHRRSIPAGVGVSVYRIVQEALSNVMRHAPRAAVAVEVTHTADPSGVSVRIENAPSPHQAARMPIDGAGHGLMGMRERAAMLGGDLTAEATDRGGFLVTAFFPLDDS